MILNSNEIKCKYFQTHSDDDNEIAFIFCCLNINNKISFDFKYILYFFYHNQNYAFYDDLNDKQINYIYQKHEHKKYRYIFCFEIIMQKWVKNVLNKTI